MASKPVRTARWATDGGATLEPSGGEKDTGWVVDDKPPARHMNFLQNTAFQWFDWLNERIFDDPTLDTTNIRGRLTAAGDGLKVTTDAMSYESTGGTVWSTIAASINARFHGLVGIGLQADLGTGLHIKISDVGIVVDTDFDNLVIEEVGDAGLHILSTVTGGVIFGNASNPLRGGFVYDHAADSMRVHAGQGIVARFDDGGSGGAARMSIGTFVPDLGDGLHIKRSDIAGATVNANGDNLVIEESINAGLTILSGTQAGAFGSIFFADGADDDVGSIRYSHNLNQMQLTVNANLQLTLADGLTKVGIGTFAPDLGRGLHIKLGDNGIGAVEPAAEELVLENNGDCGMTILSGASSLGSIHFGDLDANAGIVEYDHLNSHMNFTAGATRVFRLGSNQLAFFGTAPVVKPTVTGSRAGNAALADLLTELATLGLLTDSSGA